ncbi:MAG: hypothetical protein HY720_32605 [Planctomycetes bacterium]|nr:hypothetical protein [Planctomycetota bacterium]
MTTVRWEAGASRATSEERDRQLGEIAVFNKILTAERLQECLEIQSVMAQLDTLVGRVEERKLLEPEEKGLATAEQVSEGLYTQFRLPEWAPERRLYREWEAPCWDLENARVDYKGDPDLARTEVQRLLEELRNFED